MVEAKRPKNKIELQTAILECWEEIPLSFIRSRIQGLPKRVEKVSEDANNKPPNENMEIEQETSSNSNDGSDKLEYDSFGDEFDSEDIVDEEESEIEEDNFE